MFPAHVENDFRTSANGDRWQINSATLARLKLPTILTLMEHDTIYDTIIKMIRKEYGQHTQQNQRQSVFERKEFIEQDPNKLLVG